VSRIARTLRSECPVMVAISASVPRVLEGAINTLTNMVTGGTLDLSPETPPGERSLESNALRDERQTRVKVGA
jgi:hypothetical protein